jgi:hypothetical protein
MFIYKEFERRSIEVHNKEYLDQVGLESKMSKRGGSLGDSTILTEAYECDYERNCTPLYKAIETAEDEDEYEAILDFLESGVWTGPFEGIGGPGPLEQVKTWVTRFDPVDEAKVKWSQLPLHLSIVCGAPAQIVASLVKLYPEALRCTDDQHMLPLHLALRHESDDEVVAFLLIQFPESVNARGKNGRTAVDCALRAKDKLRGIILEIFTEKTAAKITTQMNKEKKELQNELENRTSELLSTAATLEERTQELELVTARASERSVSPTKEALEKAKDDEIVEYKEKIEKLKSEKLLQEVVAQKKLDQLFAVIKEKDVAEKKARAEEIAIKRELETVQGRVASSASVAEWKAVKREVETLQAHRLEKTRSETKSTINSLKGELERSIETNRQSDAKLKSELKGEMQQLKNIVDKLQQTESNAQTSSELTALRNEVDALRIELKERAAAKQTKVELAVMKKSMEMEIRNAEGKTNEELVALKKAVQAANASDLEKKTVKELNAMKEEFETLKMELKEKELAVKTKQDVEDLKVTLEREMMNADSKTRAELNDMKTLVESLQATLLSNNRSTDDMVAVKQEVENLKDEFKKKETASKIKLEAALLKKMVEAELKQSEGKTQVELFQMKKAIKDLADQAHGNRDVEELAKVRSELQTVKEDLKEVEKISKTQQELETLKQSLEREIITSKGKTEEELLSMKKALDAMNYEHIESRRLKKTLEEEIKNASGKTEEELKQIKKSIDSIDLRKLETKNKKEWETIRKEIDVLTAFLKKRQHDGVGETQKELRAVKEAVAAIDLNKIENKHRNEFESLRAEMEKMKSDMKEKEIYEANLKKELEQIKVASQNQPKKKKGGLKAFFFSRSFMSGEKPTSVRNISNKSQSKANMSLKKDESINEENKDDVSTILPPSVHARDRSASIDVPDDNSLSGPMRDAEESRRGKVKELTLMQTKSRDNDAISSKSAPAKFTSRMSFEKSSKTNEADVKLRNLDSRSYSKDDEFPDEEVSLKILSLSRSQSFEKESEPVIAPVPSSSSGFFSIKKAKSDIGRLISKPKLSFTASPQKQSSNLHTSYTDDDGEREQPDFPKPIRPVEPPVRKTPVSSLKGSRSAILRKVKSMDSSYAAMNAADDDEELEEAYGVVRTKSKPVVSDNGEVELQRVEEEDDDEDIMIQPRVSFVSRFSDS